MYAESYVEYIFIYGQATLRGKWQAQTRSHCPRTTTTRTMMQSNRFSDLIAWMLKCNTWWADKPSKTRLCGIMRIS